MLELNKEYTYAQICKILRWKVTGGDSKKAQLKEIESAYEFYHPMNKKTHKPKKSYTQTSLIKNGICTLKNQYFSPQNILMRLPLSAPMHPAYTGEDAEQSWL